MLASPPPGPDGGFAAVRGGVTYYIPTPQNMMMQHHHHHQQMHHPMHQAGVAVPVPLKRPKAAIPIVDPSQKEFMAAASAAESRDGGEMMGGVGDSSKLELSSAV
jgi:hypothetical protein